MRDPWLDDFKLLVGAVSLAAFYITRFMVRKVALRYRKFSVAREDWNRFLLDPKIWSDEGWILFDEFNGGLKAQKTDFDIFVSPVDGPPPLLHFEVKIVPDKESGTVIPAQAENMYKNIHLYFMG